ncbi:MAG TPA: YsnF/AvaK domain-containing protein [Isosphaeraceae bacterium]|jgi:uncharacterized protein (TIGR02271 family)|nr:YsnF/AvaK domain-containing protein [Isosphaeraceae bacterium]
MASAQRSTVVGVFEDARQADRAVIELRQAGFRDDQIGVAARHDPGTAVAEGDTAEYEQGTHVGSGALTGALTGAGLGGLVGLGVVAGIIPVLGPVIAGGTLAAILANAAGGLAIGGLAGALIGAGIPEEEAHYYHSEFEAGRTIVTVHTGDRAGEATTILRRHGAYDMQTRGATATTTAGTATGKAGAAGRKIEVREEELHAHTRPVEAGEVKVRKEVVTEHKSVEVPVHREEVVVERHPASGKANAGDIRAGEEIRVPVMEEEVVVEKKPVVKEQVTVGKRVVQDTERVAGEVKKEQVRVEREGDVDVRGAGGDASKRK